MSASNHAGGAGSWNGLGSPIQPRPMNSRLTICCMAPYSAIALDSSSGVESSSRVTA